MVKGRESDMPVESIWQTFFDPATLLRDLDCEGQHDVIEFGCGYGTFSIPAAKMITGSLYAMDIDVSMVHATKMMAMEVGVSNVHVDCKDFMLNGSGRDSASFDYAMIFNILHIEQPLTLLAESHRVLKTAGKLAVIHWKPGYTPRGPSMEIRPTPNQCLLWANQVGFSLVRHQELTGSPWHWGMVLERIACGDAD